MPVIELEREQLETSAEVEEVPRRRRLPPRRVRHIAIGLAVAGLAVLALHWLADRLAHVYVVDSRIGAGVVAVSSEVSGRIIEAPVTVGDRVTKGDLLVRIDDRKARLALAEVDAEITRAGARRRALAVERSLAERRAASELEAARADLDAMQAQQRAAAAELDVASHDFERAQSLFDQELISVEDFETARARNLTVSEQQRRAAATTGAARARLALAATEADRVQVIAEDIEAITAELEQLAAKRRLALEDLADHEIRAAFDGVVDKTFVDPGEHVSQGTRLLMYHDPSRIWVDANVKETEVGRLAIGAPANVYVDAYPDRVFGGEVIRIGHSATSEFALLPNPNPSGNFTKVTQRLPVRVALKQNDLLLRPGMMVEVKIDAVD